MWMRTATAKIIGRNCSYKHTAANTSGLLFLNRHQKQVEPIQARQGGQDHTHTHRKALHLGWTDKRKCPPFGESREWKTQGDVRRGAGGEAAGCSTRVNGVPVTPPKDDAQ